MSERDRNICMRLQKYKDLMEKLPPIATERALTTLWKNHPMFGINSSQCKDDWAKKYQETSALAEKIFKQILTLVNSELIDETCKRNEEIIEKAMKEPDSYEGCPLCFGKGSIHSKFASWEYTCPKCKGHRIVEKEEASLFEKWAK